jgi:hypothetical protein
MKTTFLVVLLGWMALCGAGVATSQDLAPRTYLVTPVDSNAVVVAFSHLSGGLDFEGAVPITGATASISLPVLSYSHSLDFFGRSSNIVVAVPYGVGNLNGTAFDAPAHAYRSGLLDSFLRFSVNLKGGPAMKPAEYMKWKQKVLIGASLKIVAPTGQYDPTRLINWGNNRWGFKPELGYSERWGRWLLDSYAAVWFYTTNPEFFSYNIYFPGARYQTQQPIGAFEGHFSYDFKPRLWVSLDGNFWFGGKTSLNGVVNPITLQRSSRVGATVSVPFTKHQAIKISYSNGAYISYGGDYQNVSVAWQYSWLGTKFR